MSSCGGTKKSSTEDEAVKKKPKSRKKL